MICWYGQPDESGDFDEYGNFVILVILVILVVFDIWIFIHREHLEMYCLLFYKEE